MNEYRCIRVFWRPLGAYTPREFLRVYGPGDEIIPLESDTGREEFEERLPIIAKSKVDAVKFAAWVYGGVRVENNDEIYTYQSADVIDLDDVYDVEHYPSDVAGSEIDRDAIVQAFYEICPEADRIWVRWDDGYFDPEDEDLLDEIVRRIIECRRKIGMGG